MPNCFFSYFYLFTPCSGFGGKLFRGKRRREKNEPKCSKMNKSRKTRLAKSPFCFHNSYCNNSRMSHELHFFSPLLPQRSVILLHHLDVLLKSIMDSWGFLCSSSSFTEYSWCYSNLSTTPSCIGNETWAPTPPPWDHPPLCTAGT